MAAKTIEYADNFLALVFNATAWANVADNAASSPLTNLYVSLHTSSPGSGGNQTTNEVSYTSYARVAVTRTSGGWTISSGTLYPVANIQFPTCTGGSATATYFGVGTASTAAGHLLYFGPVNPSISISSTVSPILVGGSNESAITES